MPEQPGAHARSRFKVGQGAEGPQKGLLSKIIGGLDIDQRRYEAPYLFLCGANKGGLSCGVARARGEGPAGGRIEGGRRTHGEQAYVFVFMWRELKTLSKRLPAHDAEL